MLKSHTIKLQSRFHQKLMKSYNLSILSSQASTLLQKAGIGGIAGGDLGPGGERMVTVTYCNVQLPERKPFAQRDAHVEERLFFVSQPDYFPENILQDAFVRFGGLVDAYFMPGMYWS